MAPGMEIQNDGDHVGSRMVEGGIKIPAKPPSDTPSRRPACVSTSFVGSETKF